LILVTLVLGSFLILSAVLHAQELMKVASKVTGKVLIDNEKVRVIEVELTPGETADWHSHPNHVIYVLTNWKLETTDKDKTAVVAEFKAGDVMYIPAVTHMMKNIGTTPMKLVVTELKPGGTKKIGADMSGDGM
jgi:quercetin dioxygenase-like cupin family protein